MQYKLLPGATFTVGADATVNINNNFIVYTKDFNDVNDTGNISPYPSIDQDGVLYVQGTLQFGHCTYEDKLFGIIPITKNRWAAFGGLITGENGAKVVFGSDPSFVDDDDDSTAAKFSVSSTEMKDKSNEGEPITKVAQLNGYSEALSTGATYILNGGAWSIAA